MMMKNRKNYSYVNKISSFLWDLPTPISINYFWNFGSMLGFCLLVQIMTGFFLSFYYSSFSSESFMTVMNIMKEVWGGWLIRLAHVNGASIFFLMIYMHMFRGIFYMSSNNTKTWISGMMMFVTLMAISFMGYVLPWGQMSYWAVAVITNLFSVIPVIGDSLVGWIWGGFSVSKPTLMRFYSVHFITPLVLTVMASIHIMLLHEKGGSSNQMGVPSTIDKIMFHPYFTVKDSFFIMSILFLMIIMITMFPYLTMDPENNIPANPMQTPLHIQPEWYFLSFYTILRAMPGKSSGVVMMSMSILALFTLTASSNKFSPKFSQKRNLIFWFLVISFLVLMFLGTMPAEEPYITMGFYWTLLYFTSISILNT